MNSDKQIGFVAGCVFAGALSILLRAPPPPPKVRRLGLPNIRASSAVIHGNTVYLSGQVGNIPTLSKCDVKEQTIQTLKKIGKPNAPEVL
jgi:enamine deaminase RidA (YjgF/YER057c/UK114 family)